MPTHLVATAEIAAPRDLVWPVLADVARWPEWTASMESIELHGSELTVGVTAVVRQPRLPPAVWTVTELDPGRSFVWVARSGGVTTTAIHDLGDRPDAGTSLRISLEQRGALAPVVRLLLGGLLRRYLETEAAGLKRRCER